MYAWELLLDKVVHTGRCARQIGRAIIHQYDSDFVDRRPASSLQLLTGKYGNGGGFEVTDNESEAYLVEGRNPPEGRKDQHCLRLRRFLPGALYKEEHPR